MNRINSIHLQKTVQSAVLAALSVLLMAVVRFPLFASAPFLEYDMADVPVLAAALLLGPLWSLAVLLVTCLIQSLTVSAAAGFWGFLMHFVASGALVIISSLIFRKSKSPKALAAGLLAGAAAMVLLMIPLNLLITPLYMGVDMQAVASLLLPAIIPFNAAKAGINVAITGILYFPLSKALEKSKLLVKE